MAYSPKYQVLSFYKYVHFRDARKFAEEHLEFCRREAGVKTRIIVADEGINGVVSGTIKACRRYQDGITSIPEFHDLVFQIHETGRPVLRKTHVRYKNELVNSGLRTKDIDPARKTGSRLSPARFREILESGKAIILDVRSKYEHRIGKFKNAKTLEIENFRGFPDKINELKKWKDKKIVTYCTGGVKCEKASEYLLQNGFRDVVQLEGGILKYAREEMGKDFEGRCYVFDERVTVDVNQVNPVENGRCIHCGNPCGRYINCAVSSCNNHVIVCEDCGWQYDGTCSELCYHVPVKRPYDGSGLYTKGSA